MKKSLLVLVALFTMILIPWNVEAAKGELTNFTDCADSVVKGDKKITTCEIGWKNDSSVDFAGGVTTITLTPEVESTEFNFKINTTYAKEDSKKGNTVTIDVEPIKAGEKAVVGTITWTADVNEEDCGGVWSPSKFKGSDGEAIDTEDEEIVESGYAIPYIALAIGAVGVVTVLATSKKKTKMYKI